MTDIVDMIRIKKGLAPVRKSKVRLVWEMDRYGGTSAPFLEVDQEELDRLVGGEVESVTADVLNYTKTGEGGISFSANSSYYLETDGSVKEQTRLYVSKRGTPYTVGYGWSMGGGDASTYEIGEPGCNRIRGMFVGD